MIQDSIQDSTRYVVNGEHKGSIMPGKRSEMWRNIYLESGSNIEGGIWGDEIFINGPDIIINGAIYARKSIHISKSKKAKGDKVIELVSVVVSPDSLITESNDFKMRCMSDLYVGRLNISNTIVYGNIYATSAKLENCIVLGGIFCKGKLQLKNTIVFTFKTKSLTILENNMLLSPFAISDEPIQMNYPVRALTFYNVFKAEENGGDSGMIEMDNDDIFRVKYADKKDEESDIPENVFVLSIAERILNSNKIIEQFRQNKQLIEFLSFGTHLEEQYQQKFENFQKKDLEDALWDIVEKGIDANPVSGSDEFDELLKMFKDMDVMVDD